MKCVKSLLIAGYSHADLGIFSAKDPRMTILNRVIRKQLRRFLEDGVEWFVFTGNLGFEYWVLEALRELQSEGYDVQTATIFLFENHGEQWSEANRSKLLQFKQVDFLKYAYPRYVSPSQFRDYNRFLIENTDGAYIFYEPENETKLKYLYHSMLKKEGYTVNKLTFDDLNEEAENFSEFE